MSTNNIRDLVLTDNDKIIEYKALEKAQKIETIKNLSTLELYNKILESDEFKKQETKEKILDEDEYINYLEEIINRDYFPDLHKINQLKKEVKLFYQIAK